MRYGVHFGDWMDNGLPDHCVNLLIADPPYFEVKGEFDFIWPTFESYLEDVKRWAAECKRLLAPNGTLLWYGSSKKIAYAQMIFDQHFDLINCLVWDKGNFMGLNHYSEMRSFAPCTERILVYSNDTENLNKSLYYVRDYVRGEIEASKGKVVFKDVNEALGAATNGGGVASTCLSLRKAEPGMLTKEMYERLQSWCAPRMTIPYDELLRKWESLRRPYNNIYKLQEVLRFDNEQSNSEQYDHPTVKPETLTCALIHTCSNEGDFVFIPFAGSGTECAMSLKEKRLFCAFEIMPKHYKTSLHRCAAAAETLTLF